MISTEIDFRFILRETKKFVVTEVKGNLDNVMRTLPPTHLLSFPQTQALAAIL